LSQNNDTTDQQTGEWSKDLTEVAVIGLKKNQKQDGAIISQLVCLHTLTAKATVRILRRRIGRKIADVLGDNQCGFRRGRGIRDAIWVSGIIPERTVDTDE
jgi:hypothetical protein